MNSRIRIILLASVSFNILLVGMFAGQHIRGFAPPPPPPPPPPPHHGPERHMDSLRHAVSEEHQKLVSDAIERNRSVRRNLHPKIHEMRMEMEQLMTAETFDKEAFKAKLEALDTLHAQEFRGMGSMLLEVLPQLGQKDRIALTEQLKAHRPPGPPHDGPPPRHPHDREPHNAPPNGQPPM